MARTAGGASSGGGHEYRLIPLRPREPDRKVYPERGAYFHAKEMRTDSNITKGVPPADFDPPFDSRLRRVPPSLTARGADARYVEELRGGKKDAVTAVTNAGRDVNSSLREEPNKNERIVACRMMETLKTDVAEQMSAFSESTSVGGESSIIGSRGSVKIPSSSPTDEEVDEHEEIKMIGIANDMASQRQSFLEAQVSNASFFDLQHLDVQLKNPILKAHASKLVDANDCWENFFISPFRLLPTDVIMPCIDCPDWAGNARMMKLISARQAEYNAAVTIGSDIARELIVQQIFISLRSGSSSARFLTSVPNAVLQLAGCPSGRIYWALAGDDTALNEIRLELMRASTKEQEKQYFQRQEEQQEEPESFDLAGAILDLMDTVKGTVDENKPSVKECRPIDTDEGAREKSLKEGSENNVAVSHPVCTDSSIDKSTPNFPPRRDNTRRRPVRKFLTTIETPLYQETEERQKIPQKMANPKRNIDKICQKSPTRDRERDKIGQKRKRQDGQRTQFQLQEHQLQQFEGLSPHAKRGRIPIEDDSISPLSFYPSSEAQGLNGSLEICTPVELTRESFHSSKKRGPVLLPEYRLLVNFPNNIRREGRRHGAIQNDTRGCVMCGKVCAFGPARNFQARAQIIPRQNKGMCKHCDIKVWNVVELNVCIKWCKGCKNFRLWASFGGRGNATKCEPCRNKAKESYLATKTGV